MKEYVQQFATEGLGPEDAGADGAAEVMSELSDLPSDLDLDMDD